MRNTLSKSEILRGRTIFADILQKGRRFNCQSFTCYVVSQRGNAAREKDENIPRIRVGFVAPKKNMRRAVERNKVKRILREVYRVHKISLFEVSEKMGCYLDIIFIFRETPPSLNDPSLFHTVEEQWISLIPQIISTL